MHWTYIFLDQKFLEIEKKNFSTKSFLRNSLLDKQFLLTKNLFFWSNIFWNQNFSKKHYSHNKFWTSSNILLGQKFFWTQIFLYNWFCCTQNSFGPKRFWTQSYLNPRFFGPKFFTPNMLGLNVLDFKSSWDQTFSDLWL